MIALKTALAAAKKLAPGKHSLPCVTMHTEDGSTIMTVQFGAQLRMYVDAKMQDGMQPFAFHAADIPAETVSIEAAGPENVRCIGPTGRVATVSAFPAYKENMDFDQSSTERSIKFLPEMQKAAAMCGKLAAPSNSSKFTMHKVALVIHGGNIVGAVATNGYALKMVGDIAILLRPQKQSDEQDANWEIMLPPSAAEAILQIGSTWHMHAERGSDTVLATDSRGDAYLRWSFSAGALWQKVVHKERRSTEDFVFPAKRVLAYKAKNAHLKLEMNKHQQRWSYVAIRTDKQIRAGEEPTVLLTEMMRPGQVDDFAPSRAVTLDPSYVKEVVSGAIDPVTISVESHDLPVVFHSDRAAKDLAMGMYGMVMPIRP